MSSRAYGLLAAGTVYVLASTSALALDAGPKCESSKLGTTAKYAQCRLKADAKAVKTGDPVDYAKCNLGKFASAETKAGMGVCPTESDQTTVKNYLDDCTSTAALWLAGGGGLPYTCDSDLVACEGDLATCEAALGLPKTGQTTAYGAGSDGDLESGAARSFTDNGDGTITDNTTGLMWEKKSADGSIHDWSNTYTWSTGTNSMDGTMVTTFLATLNGGGGFAGYTDWRIPNRNELLSIANMEDLPATFAEFSTGCVGGCTVTTCSCAQPFHHWSSTTYRDESPAAWYVYFGDGHTNAEAKTVATYVRAVRAGVPGGGPPDTCDSDLVACEGDLSTTNADLTTCEGDLSTTNADLTTCEGDLSTTNADLSSCQGDLGTCQGNLASCMAEYEAKPLRTGQTTCYDAGGSPIPCTGTGQDGDLQLGVSRSFTDNGDGTITDNKTGLMWEKLSDDGTIHDWDTTYTWPDAFAKVATLNSGSFAGHNDWRVPNRFELDTLVNLGVDFPATYSAFNSGCVAACTVLTCSCTAGSFYWTSTPYHPFPEWSWVVDFFNGDPYQDYKTALITHYVRAVRAGS